MGWVHDVPEDDLYDHEGYVTAVVADGSEPEPVMQTFTRGDGSPGASPNSSWELYDGQEGRPRAVAVRAGCSCGWRSRETFPVDFDDEEKTEGWEGDSGPFKAWQSEHIAELLGTTVPHDLRDMLTALRRRIAELGPERPLAALAALAALERQTGEQLSPAVRFARRDGHTWDTVGKALSTSRQAAYQRFGRTPPPVPAAAARWPDLTDDQAERALFGARRRVTPDPPHSDITESDDTRPEK